MPFEQVRNIRSVRSDIAVGDHLLLRKPACQREKNGFQLQNDKGGDADQPQLPQREVAKRLGISRSYVSRIEKKALKLLKDRFDKQ